MKFREVLTIKNGRNQKQVESPNGKYPIYGSGGPMGRADSFLCNAETIVIGRKGTINRPLFVDEPFWNVDTAFGLEANKSILLPKYLFYFCVNFDFEKLSTTVTIPSLTKANLLDVEIYLPPLPVQRSIVAKLDAVCDLIAKRKEQIESLHALAKSKFTEMFGDNSNTPKEPLSGNVMEMFIGPFGSSLKNDCFVPKEKSFCMVYEQKHAIKGSCELDPRYVPREKYEELKRFTVLPDDVIVSCRGTIGRVFVLPKGAPLGIMHPSIMKIRVQKKRYNTIFFRFALEDVFARHENEANGSGVKMAMSATSLGRERFPIPPLPLQQKFADFVAKLDETEAGMKKSLGELEALKKSMMQAYFG